MAKFSSYNVHAGVQNSIFNEIESVLEHGRNNAANNLGLVKQMAGLESYTPGGEQLRDNTVSTLSTRIGAAYDRVGVKTTNAQRESGAIVMAAMADPVAYAAGALSENYGIGNESYAEAPMNDTGLDTGVKSLGLEYFNDSVTLDKHMGASLRFNVEAARQSEFSEAFFHTLVLDPSEVGLMLEIEKTMVHTSVRHAINPKDNKPFVRRNILDAATDPEVLEDNSVKFIPHMVEDGSNAENFAPTSLCTPSELIVGNYSIRTNPLLVNGEEKLLLSLSAHPGLVTSGMLDESDEFDGRFALDNIYINFRKPNETAEQGKLVKFKTLNLARASFNKSQEGDGKEMSLDFTDSTFMITAETTAIDSSAVPALETLQATKWKMKIRVNATARVNLQTGYESFTPGVCKVVEVIDENGNSRKLTDPAVKAVLEGFKFELYCYDYAATRSNINRRSKGKLLDTQVFRERMKIQLGSPLTSRKPVGRTDNSAAVTSLITAARLRNDNQGITKLLSYTEQLKDVVAGITDEYELVSIEGIGRHYIRPWCEVMPMDLTEGVVAALQSSDKAFQMASAILTNIRRQVAQAYRESRFQVALEMLSGYSKSKPTVVIGTDIETANWLQEKGDMRSLGDQFTYRIVTTNDKRFVGRIQWVFEVEKEGYSPLGFGNMIWVPELITDTNLTRNDAVANEITVQPRTYHMVTCPITGVIELIGLHEYLAQKPTIGVSGLEQAGSVIDDDTLDGLNP